MINDSEVIYKKYDKLLTIDDLLHRIQGSPQIFQMGLSTNEAYVGLIEQNIGQDVYDKYFKLEYTYRNLYFNTTEYKEKREEYIKLSCDLEGLLKDQYLKEKEIIKSEEERKNLVEKVTISPEEEKIIENITKSLYKNKIELEKILENKKEVKKQQESAKIKASAFLTRINKLKEMLEKQLSKVNEIKGSFNLFKSKDFEKEIEQDFIDICLLPGAEKKEEEFRLIAKARFCMMKMEAIYLNKVKEYSSNLLKNLEVTNNRQQLVDIKLSNQVVKDNIQAEGLKGLSTDFLETSDVFLNDKVISEFYRYVYQQTIETEFAANTNIKYANLAGVAMNEFKIPQYPLKGVKGTISKLLNKYNTMFDVTPIYPLFDSVERLHQAQEISTKIEQNDEHNV